MIRHTLPLALIALAAACAEPTGTDGSESDFASRVGAGQATAAPGSAAARVANTVAKGPPPAGSNVLAIEKLGDISGVDLGPRAGGCTFSAQGEELLVAAGPADRSLPGKGVVRIGGSLIQLDTAPGGIAAIKAGTVFAGEGFSVRVNPIGERTAKLSIIKGANETRVINGDWVCA